MNTSENYGSNASEGRGRRGQSKLPRLLVLDVSKPGGSGATGQLSRTLFGDWPDSSLLHLYWDGTWPWRFFDGKRAELVGLGSVERRCREFCPELIYYRPVPFPASFHQMAVSLIDKLGCPYVVHLMDDWMKRMATQGDEGHALFDGSVHALLKAAAQRFSICEAMSEAFEVRYGTPFVAVSNGVASARILPSGSGSRVGQPFTFRYCGGLAEDMTRRSVKRLAEAVGALGDEHSVRLEVYTKNHYDLQAAQDLIGLPGVIVYESVPDSEYEELLRTADALVIAYNFDPLSCDYVRYSFANKLPECMASGVPILAFGPMECASIRFLAENGCALVVDEDDAVRLTAAVGQLVQDAELRFRLSQKALTLSREQFSLEECRSRFYSYLLAASKRATAAVSSEALCPLPRPISRSYRPDERIGFDELRFLDALLSEGGDSSRSKTLVTLGTEARSPFETGGDRAWEMKTNLDSSDGLLALSVENSRDALALLSQFPWEQSLPEGVIVRFEDRESELQGYNTHQIAVFLRRKGYRIYVSEWHPLELGVEPSWRRLCPYPCCLAEPLAWGRLIAVQGDPKPQALANASKLGLSNV